MIDRPQKQKRVLVTGGAGFIGSHLIDRLLGLGHKVICLDNLDSGSPRNFAHLVDNPNYSFMHHDIMEPVDLDVEEIFNLASPASPQHYQRAPIRTTKTSVLGAINVLELARQRGCKVLQASTSEVYGDPLIDPQPETYCGNVNPIGPRGCYDEGKRCAETLFFDYHRQHGVEVKIARIFNTYGPRMDPADGRVISNFIVQALQGAPITIYGDGAQTRSFCFVDDMVEGLLQLMATGSEYTGPINLGNPVACTVRDLAARVIRMTGARSSLEFHDLPQDDPRQRRPDIDRARKTLGWEPKIGLKEGLSRTIAHYREIICLKR